MLVSDGHKFYSFFFRYQLSVKFSNGRSFARNWTVFVNRQSEVIEPVILIDNLRSKPFIVMQEQKFLVLCYTRDVEKHELKLFYKR